MCMRPPGCGHTHTLYVYVQNVFVQSTVTGKCGFDRLPQKCTYMYINILLVNK